MVRSDDRMVSTGLRPTKLISVLGHIERSPGQVFSNGEIHSSMRIEDATEGKASLLSLLPKIQFAE